MTALVFSDRVLPGAAGYTTSGAIASALHAGRLARAWGVGSRIVSGQLSSREGKGIWKAHDRLPDMTLELLDELESLGVEHPGSYADCYHQIAPKQRPVKHSINSMFSWWRGGPWEEALRRGTHSGTWYRYDIVSAYRWAATLGLPNMHTLRACIHHRPEDVNGLWVARIDSRDDMPNTLRNAHNGLVVISSEELRAYGIRAEVVRGVMWEDVLPADYVDSTLTRLPCAKQSGRAYWGRWICRDPLRTVTPARTWDLPNRLANFVWGWLIVGRVRQRVWEASQDAAHVYVDEVLTPHRLPTGENAGDWHLKEVYPFGVRVRRTGWYHNSTDESSLVGMRTGVRAA